MMLISFWKIPFISEGIFALIWGQKQGENKENKGVLRWDIPFLPDRDLYFSKQAFFLPPQAKIGKRHKPDYVFQPIRQWQKKAIGLFCSPVSPHFKKSGTYTKSPVGFSLDGRLPRLYQIYPSNLSALNSAICRFSIKSSLFRLIFSLISAQNSSSSFSFSPFSTARFVKIRISGQGFSPNSHPPPRFPGNSADAELSVKYTYFADLQLSFCFNGLSAFFLFRFCPFLSPLPVKHICLFLSIFQIYAPFLSFRRRLTRPDFLLGSSPRVVSAGGKRAHFADSSRFTLPLPCWIKLC